MCYLDDPHVKPCLGTELFSHVSGRLGALVVGSFQRFQLLGGDRCAWSLVGTVKVELRCTCHTRSFTFHTIQRNINEVCSADHKIFGICGQQSYVKTHLSF